MKAVLLAAGEGTRLRPLTEVLPKCLMPILGVPLLEIWLRAMTAMGIGDVLINTSYKSEIVSEFLRRYQSGPRTTLAHEEKLLGTAGTVFAAMDFIGDDDVLVVHADNLSMFDANAFVSAFIKRGPKAVATMMTFTTDTPKSCGIVELTSDGLVSQMHEKVPDPPGNQANAAVYFFSRQLIRELRAGPRVSDLSTQVLPRLFARMNTYHNNGYHRDIGTIDSYMKSASETWNLESIMPSSAWNSMATSSLWSEWTQAWKRSGAKAQICASVADLKTVPHDDLALLEALPMNDVAKVRALVAKGLKVLPWTVLDA